jgi:hypothetical protein
MSTRTLATNMPQIGKRVLILAMVFLLSCSVLLHGVSAFNPTFSHSGIAYVYSNNPEAVTGSAYTINKYLTVDSYYDVEFYHRVLSANMQVGLVIKNRGSSTATITVAASAKQSGQDGKVAAAIVERDYWNGQGSKTMTIAPNGAQWVLLLQNLSISDNAVGKARLMSNMSNVEIRVVFGAQPDGASTAMSYGLATSTPPGGEYSGQTTGYFTHDSLAATYSYSVSDPSFVLPGWDPLLPTARNEYEDAQTGYIRVGPDGPLATGSVALGGNYGMAYTIAISGASGKSLSIRPKSGYSGTIVVKTPGGSWVYYSIAAGGSQTLSVTSSPWSLGVVQPGGNMSNFTFGVS